MKYLIGHSQEILGLLDALNISHEGITGIRLIVEPDRIVRLELERCVTSKEMVQVTEWILKHGIQAEQLLAIATELEGSNG